MLEPLPEYRTRKIVIADYTVDVDIEKFWAMAKIAVGSCWEWNRCITPNGYGKFSFYRGNYRASATTAHRVAYQIAVGEIPDGLQIDHLCRNKKCVNPDHLEAVTPRENACVRAPTSITGQNIRKTHCPQGHEYAVHAAKYGLKKGVRACAVCERVRALAYFYRRRDLARTAS